MSHLLILLLLVTIGLIMMYLDRWWMDTMYFIGLIITMVTGVLFLIACIAILLAPIEYEEWKAKKNATEQTIEIMREKKNRLEIMGVLQEANKINMDLAGKKYWNGLWLGDPYIDDRFDEEKPIK